MDAHGNALTLCFTPRGRPVRRGGTNTSLRSELDEADVQQQTGCRIHASYLPATAVAQADPTERLLRRPPLGLPLGEFVHLALLGTARIGTP